MRASILIPNHNYERYQPAAIDGALGQTHPDIEVIVVDDGSTDGSRDVIRSYGDRITAVFKPQGGPVSALNAGFERSSGELICLLDVDDIFLPAQVEKVLEAWRRCPEACVVHHRMQIIDRDGRTLHKPFPRRVHGDLRARVARSGGWFLHAPSSGLAFPRFFAEHLFPVPTDRGNGRVNLEVDSYLAARPRSSRRSSACRRCSRSIAATAATGSRPAPGRLSARATAWRGIASSPRRSRRSRATSSASR